MLRMPAAGRSMPMIVTGMRPPLRPGSLHGALAPTGRRIVRGTGGRVEVTEISDIDITVADDRRRLRFAVVSDLAAISSAFGRPIDLILAEVILAGRCVVLDFTQDQIGFAPTGSFAGGSGWHRLALTRGTNRELLVAASIGGRSPVQLIFDLGSADALMLSSSYVAAGTSSPAKLGRPRRLEAWTGSDRDWVCPGRCRYRRSSIVLRYRWRDWIIGNPIARWEASDCRSSRNST